MVLAWNQQLLDSIKETKTGPTIAARALAVLHTAIYDAWTAYDATAVPTMANGNGRRPTAGRTVANKSKAVSFAAYAALVDLYPARQTIFADKMTELYGPDFAADTTVPATVGTKAAQAVLDYRHRDGANQLGDEPGGTPGVAYSDYTGYRPVNTWDKINNPDRWQPLCVPTPPPGTTSCTGRIQTFLTPSGTRSNPSRSPRRRSSARPGPTPIWVRTGSPAASTWMSSTR